MVRVTWVWLDTARIWLSLNSHKRLEGLLVFRAELRDIFVIMNVNRYLSDEMVVID